MAARLVDPAVSFGRARLGYRDVAGATNRLTLIAAVLPAGCVTTHTVLCSKAPLDGEALDFLCGVLNSYVANYLVRPWVVTHVGAAIVDRLPVPAPPRGDPLRRRVAALARALAADPGDASRHARLQALAARLYGLTAPEFEHVLGTFPLVGAGVRQQALAAFLCWGRDGNLMNALNAL